MRLLIVGIVGSMVLAQEEQDNYEYIPIIDPVRRALAFAANTTNEARRLGGVFGLCAMDVIVPETGVLVCDPPNQLPQICTLSCKSGYYSSGLHRDIACADAMCEGTCSAQKYDCKGMEIHFATRECEYMRYVPCDTYASGMCIESATEPCNYSYYEEVSRPCCNITMNNPPEGCWTSGCSGTCNAPGVFHYFSAGCGDVCPPWRDPETPQFACSPCKVPTQFNAKSIILSKNANDGEIPSEIKVGCETGYWGTSVRSFCMSTDGSFYPPVSDVVCKSCELPPILEGEFFERVIIEANEDGTVGAVEFRCLGGFVGDSTFSICDSENGTWSNADAPYCEPAPTSSLSTSAMHSVSPQAERTDTNTLQQIESPSPSASPLVSPSETATYSRTPTPSASKSPRPPKVKGSRAPTQPPKLRIKAQ